MTGIQHYFSGERKPEGCHPWTLDSGIPAGMTGIQHYFSGERQTGRLPSLDAGFRHPCRNDGYPTLVYNGKNGSLGTNAIRRSGNDGIFRRERPPGRAYSGLRATQQGAARPCPLRGRAAPGCVRSALGPPASRLNSGATKASVDAAAAGAVVVTARRTAAPRVVVPGPAANHTGRASFVRLPNAAIHRC